MGERTCVTCARPFVPHSNRGRRRQRCYECVPKAGPACPCARCGQSIRGSLPPGERICNPCRRRARGADPRRSMKPARVGTVPCAGCGTLFIKKNRGVRCAACAPVWRAERARIRNRNRIQPPRPCEFCGREFTCIRQSTPVRFCSRSCGARSSMRSRPRKPASTSCDLVLAQCLLCRDSFVVRGAVRSCPSEACRRYILYSRMYAAKGRPPPGVLVKYPCRGGCGALSTPLRRQGGWTCDTCKAVSIRRARERERLLGSGTHRARARRYGVPYEPIDRAEVFARDGWRCGICGKAVDRRIKSPHPMSASLDHIIPMSLGGPHLPHNVQCAHFGCNSRKCNKPMGEQLLLVG